MLTGRKSHISFIASLLLRAIATISGVPLPSFLIEKSTLCLVRINIVTCESRDIRLRGNHVTYSPYSGEQARANGLVRSTLLSRSRKGCCVVQRKIASRSYLFFHGISKGEGTRPFDLAGRPV